MWKKPYPWFEYRRRSLRHISKPYGGQKALVAAVAKFAATAMVPLMLSGCMGFGLDATDTKLTTNSVDNPQSRAPADTVSDELTIRNAVSSADLSRMSGSVSIPWANTTTGSAGVITSIREENNGSYVCRTFITTRHSYRGISNFGGKACLVGSGEWQVVAFKEMT